MKLLYGLRVTCIELDDYLRNYLAVGCMIPLDKQENLL